MQERLARIEERLDALERRIGELERGSADERAASQKRLQAVIEVVKAENEQLRAAIERGNRGRGGAAEHTVRPGDTLAEIARRYGVRAKEIMDANALTDADKIQAGRKLTIPRPAR